MNNECKSNLLHLGYHLEPAKGCENCNYIYCSKEESRIGFQHSKGIFNTELCTCPNKRGTVKRKLNIDEWIKEVKEGAKFVDLVKKYPRTFLHKHNALYQLHNYISPITRSSIQVIWIYGPSGKGKSYFARKYCKWALNELPFNKPLNKWWCNYKQEAAVLLDDFAPNMIHMRHLLKWFDVYKVSGEVKSMPDIDLNFSIAIVTSNFTPEQCFPGEDVTPLKRRIHHYLDLTLGTIFPNSYCTDMYEFNSLTRKSNIETFE